MQSLTAEQADALLDVIDACHHAIHDHEQHQFNPGTLRELITRADFMGVDKAVIRGACKRNLPADLYIRLYPPSAP